MANPVINVEKINKSFKMGVQDTQILFDISFTVEKGDFLIILGPSGCGKSTLLHTILGLEPPTSGHVQMLDKNVYLNTVEDDRSLFRKHHIGMVYQQPNWIKSLTVGENVAFPLLLLGYSKTESLQKAWQVLAQLKIENWINYVPAELSSGQQQRASLARALINDPEFIIADEPTGNLDYDSGQILMQLLSDLSNNGKTVLMVTHDLEYLKFAKTALRMKDGHVIGIYQNEQKEQLEKEVKTKRGVQASI